ncbi:MAG: EAL domain-containing protein [Lachnospiraceae bacterium]|nr:EAL domain-containing protein [Lachnospiraceae bacterium]
MCKINYLFNKIILLIILLFLAGGFYFFSIKSYSAEAPEVVLYQVDQNYPPFTYSNESHIYGFDPDLINLIFRTADYKVQYSYDTWPEVYRRISSGEIDVAGIIAVTSERSQNVLFTDTLFSSSVTVYTKNDFKKIEAEDLPQLKIGVGQGYYTEEILKNTLKHKNYITYLDLNQAIEDLEQGTIDAIFEDHWLMDSLFVARKDKGHFSAQIVDLYPLPHAYAVSKDRPELVGYMNSRINDLRKKGIFEEIYMKYFYSHSEYYLEQSRKQTILLTAIIAVSVLALVFGLKFYIDILKRRLLVNYEKLKEANNMLAGANDQLQSQYEEIQAQYEEIQAQYEEIEINRNELEKSEERYRLITSAANDGLWDWDMVTDTLYLSEKWATMMGFPASVVVDLTKNWHSFVHLADDRNFIEQIKHFWKSDITSFSKEIQIGLGDLEYHWYLVKAAIIRNSDHIPLRMAGTISDINDKKAYEERIFQLAYYDHLTNIPNRVLLQERLAQIIKNVIDDETMVALYYIDLDNFKHINDTLGHVYGDVLLKAIALELLTLKSKHFCTFRVGGDEFIVIIENISSQAEINSWADQLLSLFNKTWILNEGDTYLTASIGVTVIPNDGMDVHKILKSADAAMYEAKADGRGVYRRFDEEMLNKVSTRSELEKQLRKAVEHKDFELYYQPFYRITDGALVGLEALIRWNHPVKGIISPAQFIPLAEETGLIKEIGQWVIDTACRQCAVWQKMGYFKIPVAVNVSEKQLEDPEFISGLKRSLSESGLEPEYLHVEITESCVIKFLDPSIELLHQLHNMGIKIALDDFGTGYSSLHYLQCLPIDTVKIDKSFIDHIITNPPDTLIISEIISIAHKLSMNVIAEGIELPEQITYLKQEHGDYMQGFYLSKPLPAKQIESLIKN